MLCNYYHTPVCSSLVYGIEHNLIPCLFILLQTETVEEPIEEDEQEEAKPETKEDEEAKEKKDDEDEATVEEEKEEKPKTKKVEKTTWDWILMNDVKPIWLRT